MNFIQFGQELTPSIPQQPKSAYESPEDPRPKVKLRKAKRDFLTMEEETHKRLEKLADEMLKQPEKKRVRKQKNKAEESEIEDNSEYAVCLKYNQLSNQQLTIKNNILQISDNLILNPDQTARESYRQTTPAYPYTGLLTKHVQSIQGRPIFYFEVKFVGKINPEVHDCKAKDFAVGFSTGEFCGAKIVGGNNESIGICGDGKIHFKDNSNSNQAVQANEGDFKFFEGMVIGVGYIMKTRQVLFTVNGQEVKSVELPLKLTNKYLYPAISLGSRELHKVEINLGMKRFMFNLDDYVQNKYYKQIFEEIQGFQSFHNKSLTTRGQKFQKITQNKQFHEVIKDYLISNGFVETFKEVFCEPSTSESIRNYCEGPSTNDPTSKSNETCEVLFDEYKPTLFDIESRQKLQNLIECGQVDLAIQTLQTDYPSLWSQNRTIECSLLSLKFIQYFKADKYADAIELLKSHPLNHNDFYRQEFVAEIVSINEKGEKIMIQPQELTRLFCIRKNREDDPLLTKDHLRTVAQYVQDQIYSSLKKTKGKLTQMLQHSALNINYGLSNFYKHKLYDCNPQLRKKQAQIDQKRAIKNQFQQNIGINVPHYNPNEHIRELQRTQVEEQEEQIVQNTQITNEWDKGFYNY